MIVTVIIIIPWGKSGDSAYNKLGGMVGFVAVAFAEITYNKSCTF